MKPDNPFRPDNLLSAVRTLEPLIRKHADEAEQQHRLSQPVVTALAEAGIFRMYTPLTLGGFEVDPLTFCRVVEELARIDASTAWCVFVAAGNPVFAGAFLPDKGAEAVFGREPTVVTAGAVFPYGRAVVRDDGYVVSGRWPYASGCQHSAWLFCCCNIFDSDQIRLTESGDPEVRVLFVPTTQISIIDTWDVSGLAGTGSHDVLLDQVFVSKEYTGIFGSKPHSKHFQGPLYRYPFFHAAGLPMGGVALGIAEGAVETCLELAHTKRPAGKTTLLREQPLFHLRIAEAVSLVRSARAWLHAAFEEVWETILTSGQVTFAQRADLVLAGANATRSAAAAVDIAYTLAGATANYRRSPLQRALRDIHAVTQHIATGAQQYENAGRMLVGLQPHYSPIVA